MLKNNRISRFLVTLISVQFNANFTHYLVQTGIFFRFELKYIQNIFFCVNPKRPGRFCNFSKNWIKNFKLSISPQLRVPEKRTIARGLVVTTEYHWDLLRKNLLCKCMRLVFAMGQDFLRKLDFAKN